MDLLTRDLFDTSAAGVICFLAVFAGFIYVFARSDAGSLLLGLLRLAWSVLTAPMRYLESCAANVVEYRSAASDHRSDRQFLLQRVLLISNAWVLILACGILAAGLVSAWGSVYPEETRAQRRELKAMIQQAEPRIAIMEKEVTDLSSKLGGETDADRRIKELTDRQAKLSASLTTERQALDQAGANEWRDVSQYLARSDQGRVNDFDARNAVQQISTFLQRSRLDAGARDKIANYAQIWADSKIVANQVFAEQQNNPRLRMSQQKAVAENEIQQANQLIAQWKERLAFGELWKQLHFGRGIAALVRTFLACVFFVWLTGLLIEGVGLAVDLAKNMRLTRQALEKAPATEPHSIASLHS